LSELVFLMSVFNIFTFPSLRPAADYVFYLVFPSVTCFSMQFLRKFRTFHLALLHLLYVIYYFSAILSLYLFFFTL